MNSAASSDENVPERPQDDAWREVACAFLKLGLTSFGGPVAHIGYFRQELVMRRRWLSEAHFADLVALCQFLPGPASSQLGFALGLMRGGARGAIAAWCAFTLPSALLLLFAAYAVSIFQGEAAKGLIHGLKLVAVAAVANAVWSMARTLTPDLRRVLIALAAILVLALAGGVAGQICAILAGATAGLLLCRGPGADEEQSSRFLVSYRAAHICIGFFVFLLLVPQLLYLLTGIHAFAMFDAFFRAGAMVFGGGHVVLPLLETAIVDPGWISRDNFLAGYAAAQAVPGPLFTFAAYLGAAMQVPPSGLAGAVLALAAIFIPGLLLLLAALPYWDALCRFTPARAAMQGVNAAVVGILAAALYNPVWTSAIATPIDAALALAGFLLLTFRNVPPVAIVMCGALAGIAIRLLQT